MFRAKAQSSAKKCKALRLGVKYLFHYSLISINGML
jgi:hypothetical protein